ncbi:MAG: amino acid ABC transporter permease [Clostridia bacterium]|nr:amino acid ABC transporter permease [Clostridia bacterium]
MGFDLSFMLVALKAALRYTPTTLLLALVPLVIGLVFGTLIALIRVFHVKWLHQLSKVFVVVVKGIPVVLLLLITYFTVIQIWDVLADKLGLSLHAKDIDMKWVAIVALSFFAIVNISEAVRGALVSVGKGQYEAAYSIGLSKLQTLRRVVLPQAFPVAIPMLSSSLIGLIKGSSLAFMVSVTDLMNGALIQATANYKFLEAYIAAAIVYWGLCILIEKCSYMLEKRLKVSQ